MRQFISLALVATAAAQMDMKALIGDLSPQCQAAAGSLVTSDFSTCNNLMGLVNVLGATGSLLAPLNTWADGVCSIPPCSTSVISAATTTVQGGCEADAKKGVPVALEISTLVSNYAAVRKALCLEYKSNHIRCASDLLATTEKVTGRPLTSNEISAFLSGGVSSLAPALAKAPKDNLCNDCSHALTTVLSPSAPMAMNSTMSTMPMNSIPSQEGRGISGNMTSSVAALCGSSFVDGMLPDSITVNNGASASSNPSNGAKNPANYIPIPVFASLTILGTATVFTTLF